MSNSQHYRDNPAPDHASREGARTLIYFPIIHTPADMGALRDSVVRATLEKVGRAGWARKSNLIQRVWDQIEAAIDSLTLSFDRVRLYQDGLPVCGREAEIVTELAAAGNRNHQLLQRLMARGATLMGTESAELLLEEYQAAKRAVTARAPRSAGVAAMGIARRDDLLQRRDQFVAQRLADTLKPGETGILFMGMLHAVERYLPEDIKVSYPLFRPH